GFCQEVESPRLHGTHACRYVAVAGHEDDGQVHAALPYLLMELQPVQVGETDIEQRTRRPVVVPVFQELASRPERPHFVAGHPDQSFECVPDSSVIIDHEYGRACSGHGTSPARIPEDACAGVPSKTDASARARNPWPSDFDRMRDVICGGATSSGRAAAITRLLVRQSRSETRQRRAIWSRLTSRSFSRSSSVTASADTSTTRCNVRSRSSTDTVSRPAAFTISRGMSPVPATRGVIASQPFTRVVQISTPVAASSSTTSASRYS